MRKFIPFAAVVQALPIAWVLAVAAPSFAAAAPPVTATAAQAADHLQGADVVILGETHDNEAHHRNQAEIIARLGPRAVVWEMITQQQADLLTPDVLSSAERTAEVLEWETSGWPEFGYYAPVFAAAASARQYGALVPRAAARDALEQGVAAYFGPRSVDFGLDQPLTEVEQAEREADQLANHCNAMPGDMLPVLVDFQRLRDAVLARAADRALAEVGGPVVVITGNGHARLDRGLAVYLQKVRPEITIRSLGQSEGGAVSGDFDLLLDSPPVERPDPCLAFRKS